MQISLLARLLAVARTVTPLAPANPVTLPLHQLAPGQSFRAEVTARLAAGTFRAVAGDVSLELALPAGTRIGDVVSLRLIAREPRLAFEIDAPLASVQPRLSGAGRLIDRILHDTRDPRPSARPVTAGPVADAGELRAPLERAIAASGLFYESHQARWIDGDYPLALLREEPQARLARAHHAPEQRADASDGEAPEHSDESAQEETHARLECSGPRSREGNAPQPAAARPPGVALLTADGGDPIDITSAFAPAAATAQSAPADDGAQSAVLREILPIVRQQLEAIETRQIVWQGELWPGQFMRWEIGEEARDPQRPQDAPAWRTHLALRLPALGAIRAELALGAQGVRVAVVADDQAAADALRSRARELAQALEAAGLPVASLEIRHEG